MVCFIYDTAALFTPGTDEITPLKTAQVQSPPPRRILPNSGTEPNLCGLVAAVGDGKVTLLNMHRVVGQHQTLWRNLLLVGLRSVFESLRWLNISWRVEFTVQGPSRSQEPEDSDIATESATPASLSTFGQSSFNQPASVSGGGQQTTKTGFGQSRQTEGSSFGQLSFGQPAFGQGNFGASGQTNQANNNANSAFSSYQLLRPL